jgi:hypothetical protein
MSESQVTTPESSERQRDADDLIERDQAMPGVADALRAYANLQRAMSWQVATVPGKVEYGTGGNA